MRNSRLFSLLALAALIAPSLASGQTSPGTASGAAPAAEHPLVTLLSQPAGTRVEVRSRGGEVHGLTPLDIPATFSGPFRVTVEGTGVARTRGSIAVPADGGQSTLLSEPRGASVSLLVHSLSFPGVPDLVSGRRARGGVLGISCVVGLAATAVSHRQYRDRLSEFGAYAADRADDERLARDDWAKFSAATWGLSILDYWIRPRLEIDESGKERVIVSAPPITRGAIVWRSLIVPGAGQEFANHRARGAFWLASAIAAGAGFAAADAEVEKDQTQFDWARAYVDSAGPSEQAAQLREVARRSRDLQSSEDLRRGFRYAMIGVYFANIVDALFIPTGTPEASGKSRITTSAIVRPDGSQILATLHF